MGEGERERERTREREREEGQARASFLRGCALNLTRATVRALVIKAARGIDEFMRHKFRTVFAASPRPSSRAVPRRRDAAAGEGEDVACCNVERRSIASFPRRCAASVGMRLGAAGRERRGARCAANFEITSTWFLRGRDVRVIHEVGHAQTIKYENRAWKKRDGERDREGERTGKPISFHPSLNKRTRITFDRVNSRCLKSCRMRYSGLSLELDANFES